MGWIQWTSSLFGTVDVLDLVRGFFLVMASTVRSHAIPCSKNLLVDGLTDQSLDSSCKQYPNR